MVPAARLCLRAAVGVTLAMLAAARVGTQSPSPARPPLLAELAARVASSIQPQLRVALEPGGDAAVDAAITEQLSARGVQVAAAAAAEGAPTLRVSCFDNLRERACAAEIGGATRNTILITRPHEPAPPSATSRMDLALRPLVSAEIPILDVARRGDDELFALMRGALVRYERRGGGWVEAAARAIASARPWPRDMRGRIRIADARVDVFVPSVRCTGTIEPLAVTCAEAQGSWPLDMEDARLEPGRNYFTAPGGLTFYGVARLGPDAGARWLAATLDDRLTFVDQTRRAASSGVRGADVVALPLECASGPHVLASAPAGEVETLTLFRVARRQLTAATGALVLPGELTALWPAASGDAATVVTRDRDAGRYVAHELTVSCPR